MPPSLWHTKPGLDVCRALGTDPGRGLASRTVRQRQSQYGPNRLQGPEKPSLWSHFIGQFRDVLVLVLLGAALLSLALGEWHDALAILVIVTLNAAMGLIQEYRAEQSLQMLQRLSAPQAVVVRDGRPQQVDSAGLVPGDIVLVESGSRIPADCRLLESTGLEADESPLTGESVPVLKDENWTGPPDTELGDRRNMLYLGASVARGWGKAVVTATGMDTEVGKIAHLLQGAGQGETPLQRRLAQLGKHLVVLCLTVVAAVFGAGLWNGIPLYRMFLTAVSLAVAAIPEGLPAAVTVALALGVQRMARRRAIVRKLPAVETLGCATVICSDKTGTLTLNEMAVTDVWLPGQKQGIQVESGDGAAAGRFLQGGRPLDPRREPQLLWALAAAALCNHAHLPEGGHGPFARGRRVTALGDPTEIALLAAARKAGLEEGKLRGRYPLVVEAPFDSDRRMMSVLCRGPWPPGGPSPAGKGGGGGGAAVISKGAAEAVLSRCRFMATPEGPVPLTGREREAIAQRDEFLASRGLRVLAVAWRPLPPGAAGGGIKAFDPAWEQDLVFGGLIAMQDPPRPDVREALQRARAAGVRTIMLTGDHPATARYIARTLGMPGAGGAAVTGRALDGMDDAQLADVLQTASVFARVSPAHKLRIVRILKGRGEVIAMTGDGVNDAPAIKEADIGIAMGRTGSDVAREASDMVLADDNFATIVAAIEEGRGIYANIRKFIRYLLTCNVGEILAMFLAVLAGFPLPLLPLQILWMNLVTDGLPAMALGLEKAEPGAMSRPPRRPDEPFFAGGLQWRILYRGMLIGLQGLGAFALALLWAGAPLEQARTLAFTTLVFAQLLFAFQCRSEYTPWWRLGLWSNPYLVGAVLVSTAMQLAVVFWPPFQQVFGTAPFPAWGWGAAAALIGAGSLMDRALKGAQRQIARPGALG